MTPEQLQELNVLCREDPDAFERAMDSLPPSRCVTTTNGSLAYLVPRSTEGADEAISTSQLTPDLHHQLFQLMTDAGIAPEICRRLPTEYGGLPETPSKLGPDEQVLASLRLTHLRASKMKPVIVSAARERLAHLLVTYPVLVHPRFLWDADPETVYEGMEAKPLVHHLAARRTGALPIAGQYGISDAAHREFALHPAVALALRAKCPEISKKHGRRVNIEGSIQGKTVGALLLKKESNPSLLTCILQVERVLKECRQPGVLKSRTLRAGVENQVVLCVRDQWAMDVRQTDGLLLQELILASRREDYRRLLPHFLADSWRLVVSTDWQGTSTPCPDSAERTKRLHDLLVAIRAVPDAEAATRATLIGLFPRGGEGLAYAPVAAAAEQCAHRLVESWKSVGIPLREIRERVDAWMTRESVWSRVLERFENEKAMVDTIDAAAVPDMGAAAVRRRRARL